MHVNMLKIVDHQIDANENYNKTLTTMSEIPNLITKFQVVSKIIGKDSEQWKLSFIADETLKW